VDDKLRKIVADMYETMVKNWGVGLAAIQVGVAKRLFIYEIPKREMTGYETCPTPKEKSEGESEGSLSSEEAEEEGGYTGNYTVCINPRIISKEGSYIEEEGCLSKVGWVAKVERAIKVTFEAYDLEMKRFERTVEGLEARCVQHEIDHLDGILFTDRAIPGTLREITEEELEESESLQIDSAPSEEVEETVATE